MTPLKFQDNSANYVRYVGNNHAQFIAAFNEALRRWAHIPSRKELRCLPRALSS